VSKVSLVNVIDDVTPTVKYCGCETRYVMIQVAANSGRVGVKQIQKDFTTLS
jgi:hypothetical protein